MGNEKKKHVLMIGPGREVRGGISAVVESYYACGLDKAVDLTYLPTMKDGSKFRKLIVACKAWVAFGRLLKKCDIVHVHMAAQASFDRKALFVKRAKKKGKKVIIHQHAADFDRYFYEQVDDKKRMRIREVFAMADKVIALSEEWSGFFGKNVCDPGKIEIVYNGVVMPKYEKKDYRDHNVLMLGRLCQRKGTYDLLKAIPKVVEKIDDVVFYLGGDGDVEQCKKVINEEFGKHVKFLGWVQGKDKEEYFQKCSTFILPSYHEGMPMAVLEAMSYGMATISTNTGGIPQIIQQGVNGIRIDAGDVDAIVQSLVDVLGNEKKRTRLGAAGRERVRQKFDLRANIRALEIIYRSI